MHPTTERPGQSMATLLPGGWEALLLLPAAASGIFNTVQGVKITHPTMEIGKTIVEGYDDEVVVAFG